MKSYVTQQKENITDLSNQEWLIYLLMDGFQIVRYIRSDLRSRIFKFLFGGQKSPSMKNESILIDCLEESCNKIQNSIDQFTNLISDSFQVLFIN